MFPILTSIAPPDLLRKHQRTCPIKPEWRRKGHSFQER
jgi:hypothetical protein